MCCVLLLSCCRQLSALRLYCVLLRRQLTFKGLSLLAQLTFERLNLLDNILKIERKLGDIRHKIMFDIVST